MNCLGIPVIYDPEMESVSITLDRSRWWWPWKFARFPGLVETRGLFRWKYIVTGRTLYAFPPREQQAILLHEVGHARMNHIEKRLLRAWQIVLWPFGFARFCIMQEFQADNFAAHCGYAVELASALSRMSTDHRASLHPAVADRLARLAVWHSKV